MNKFSLLTLPALLAMPLAPLHAAEPPKSEKLNVLFLFADDQRALATQGWKLIRYPQVNQTQLFDLQADPYEIQSLVADPKQAARVAELSALMKQKLTAAGDSPTGRRSGKSDDKDGIP